MVAIPIAAALMLGASLIVAPVARIAWTEQTLPAVLVVALLPIYLLMSLILPVRSAPGGVASSGPGPKTAPEPVSPRAAGSGAPRTT